MASEFEVMDPCLIHVYETQALLPVKRRWVFFVSRGTHLDAQLSHMQNFKAACDVPHFIEMSTLFHLIPFFGDSRHLISSLLVSAYSLSRKEVDSPQRGIFYIKILCLTTNAAS